MNIFYNFALGKRKADKFRFYSRMSLKRMLLGDRYEI